MTLSDHLLRAVLNLLRREVSEHGRHLQQYFNLFVMYANLGKLLRASFLKSPSEDVSNETYLFQVGMHRFLTS